MADPDPTTDSTWRDWVSAHRKQVKLTAWLLVAALVGSLVLVWTLSQGPKGLVADYLDAIQDGDTDAALAIVGEPDTAGRVPFLSAAALADDWTVDTIVERRLSDYAADIDVTFSTGNISEHGSFRVVRDDPVTEYVETEEQKEEKKEDKNDWRIEEPFVEVDLDTGGLGFVELGGMRRETGIAGENGTVPLLLFPGVYKLYPSVEKRATVDPGVLVATPVTDPYESPSSHSPHVTLTDAGAREAQRAINAHIDTCEKKTDESPDGCPFSSDGLVKVLDDLVDLTWQVVTYPEARFVIGPDGFHPVVRKVGTATATATVTRDGGPPTTVTTTCEFGFANMKVELTTKGFTVSGVAEDGSSGASIQCF